MRSLLLACLALPFLWLAASATAPAQERPAERTPERRGVVVVPIHGPLSEEMVALTRRAIGHARSTHARAIVFEIDSEGGDVELMDRMIDSIERVEELQTIAWVTQKAASAGSLIAISCQRLYMSPGSNMGSALVLMVPQFFGLPLGALETLRDDNAAYFKKIISHYRAHWRAKAQANDRPAALAEAMVWSETDVFEVKVDQETRYLTPSEIERRTQEQGEGAVVTVRKVVEASNVLNLTAQEAFDCRMIDGLATSRNDLLAQLGLQGEPLEPLAPNWSERLAGFVQTWGFLFLIAGLIAVFVEIKLPGFGLPGILGIAFLGLWMFGKYLAGLAEVTELLLIAGGFALIAVELFLLPGTLLAGVAGAVLVIGGLLLAAQETFLPDAARPQSQLLWWSATQSLALTIAGSAVGMAAVAHFLPRIPFLNRAILKPGRSAALVVGGATVHLHDELEPGWRPAVGARGEAVTLLRPAGKVRIEGRELDAVSDGALIERGRAIVVVAVEPGRLVVKDGGGNG